MTRTKSLRYNAASNEPLLIQSGKSFFENCKGKWGSDYFGNQNPIVLELACGRGEYTVGLSQIYPDKNFIGVDIKGERMMMGIKKWKQEIKKIDGGDSSTSFHFAMSLRTGEQDDEGSMDSTKPNIGFLRTIIHHIDQFFAPKEVDEIWIIHPDPRPKGHDARRRITSPRFLIMYESILKSGGLLKLRTDDDGMFEYSLEQIELGGKFELLDSTRDLDNSSLASDHHGIETHYGKLFKAEGRTIKYGIWKKK